MRIPACAGEPRQKGIATNMVKVYPRVCGGTRCAASALLSASGLSPRVRGNRAVLRVRGIGGFHGLGSIPACAGEPASISSSIKRYIPDGSIPACAGDPSSGFAARLCIRSIPACAGEPLCAGRPSQPTRVYPRVCGGTASNSLIRVVAKGLSPRVRGNRPAWSRQSDGSRSIPACAGEPLMRFRAS